MASESILSVFSALSGDTDEVVEESFCVGVFNCLFKSVELFFLILAEIYTMLSVNPDVFRACVLLQVVSLSLTFKDPIGNAVGRFWNVIKDYRPFIFIQQIREFLTFRDVMKNKDEMMRAEIDQKKDRLKRYASKDSRYPKVDYDDAETRFQDATKRLNHLRSVLGISGKDTFAPSQSPPTLTDMMNNFQRLEA